MDIVLGVDKLAIGSYEGHLSLYCQILYWKKRGLQKSCFPQLKKSRNITDPSKNSGAENLGRENTESRGRDTGNTYSCMHLPMTGFPA